MDYFLGLFSGLILGLSIHYLADVLPVFRRISPPVCTNCGEKYSFIIYLIWMRRCRRCQEKRSIRTWLIVIGMSIFGSFWFGNYSPTLGLVPGFLLMGFLTLITVIDFEHRVILHLTSVFGVILGLWIGIMLHGIQSTLLGGFVGFGIMYLFYFLGLQFVRLARKLRGREFVEKDAIGFGDVNLSGVVGLILGWPGVLMGMIIAVLSAGGASLLYLIWMFARKKYQHDLAIPYGPFLAISAFLLIFIKPIFF